MTHSPFDSRASGASQVSFSSTWISETLGTHPAPPRFGLNSSPSLGPISFNSLCTDTRQLSEGSFFIAIRGETLDGHAFIGAAIKKGARGILVEESYALGDDLPDDLLIFRVPDTLLAFRTLAGAWRRNFQIPVVSIAGANGKTTTKEFLGAILRGRFAHVLKTEGSQNGYLGLALTLIRLRPEDSIAVIEIGIDEIGAMHQHLELVKPTHSLVTLIAPEHLEKLLDIETVAREENLSLLETANSGGTVLVNRDDPRIDDNWFRFEDSRRWSYSTARPLPPGPRHLSGRTQPASQTIAITGGGWSSEVFSVPLPGRHNAHNLLAAITAARSLGLSADEIRKGLATFRGAMGRSEVKHLGLGTTVICDYYNSSPASLQAALDTLQQEVELHPGSKPMVALGDMLELGDAELDYHRAAAPLLIGLGAQPVHLYGPRMRALHEELKRIRPDFQSFHFDSHSALTHELRKHLRSNTILLIKGSRGMRMEKAWDLLSSSEILSPHPDSLARAASLLQQGELVGIPTETVYGLAGNGLDETALTKIFSTKERPQFDPLILHISPSLDGITPPSAVLQASGLVDFALLSPTAKERVDRLVDRFWPGPLTLVLPKCRIVPDLATSGLQTVAIRMPAHLTAQQLIRMAGFPLAAPSANRFGRISPTTALEVITELGKQIPAVVDGGKCEIGLESTILAVSQNGDLQLLRPGRISTQEIEDTAGVGRDSVLPLSRQNQRPENSAQPAPGMLPSHYSPLKALSLIPDEFLPYIYTEGEPAGLESKWQELSEWLRNRADDSEGVGILWMTPPPHALLNQLQLHLKSPIESRVLSPQCKVEEAARNLFGYLRSLDESSAGTLFVAPLPKAFDRSQGLGYAIQDRLTRAAHPRAAKQPSS
jgi:tRNA threonylcarbamoyl adenosine modification protein (Sua5/YciO/YrdC/YwlC family)